MLNVSAVASAGVPGDLKKAPPHWIVTPGAPAGVTDVVYFHRNLSLSVRPKKFLVNVSADPRFELEVNGKRVGAGPAMADVPHWRYETYDLAPYLRAGMNTIAAVVWNFGVVAATGQLTSQTAFLLWSEDSKNKSIDTGEEGWKVSHDDGRTAVKVPIQGYIAAPQESMNGNKMNWKWNRADAGSSGEWLPAKVLGPAVFASAAGASTPWILQKDELPAMQYALESAGTIVRSSGIEPETATSLDKPITVPANSSATILLDRTVLTTAYPSLVLRGGKDSSVHLTYAEALYDEKSHRGNRNEIAGRHIKGVKDEIVSDGAEHTYRTLWWRTWRYVQLDVKTADIPLTIERFDAFYTAYPFSAVAQFKTDDAQLDRIWDTGWRTARLCSHETYMDTPYWEQLQYVGDTRIQALVSYAVAGDDRLAKQAMLAYRDSQLPTGLTLSRYPSKGKQVIPPYSLLWVGMLHDFWMYRDDPAFVKSILPGTRGVLDWFSARQRADGVLGKINGGWPFVDWNPHFVSGEPPQETDGGSAVLTLQFLEALRYGAELEDSLGEKARADHYREEASKAAQGLLRLNWDDKAGLLADTPAKKSYSQQANSLAVWLDVLPKEQQHAVMSKVLAAPDKGSAAGSAAAMLQASFYFRFYVAQGMVHAGMGDEYIAQLKPWRDMLHLGLSTWAETPEPSRSDSHAWSAHPTVDLLSIVAGITPASEGFGKVQINPHLGELTHLTAIELTPKGQVKVQYIKNPDGWIAMIHLPTGLQGEFNWKGEVFPLHSGEQKIKLKSE